MTITFDPPITSGQPSPTAALRELCRIESMRYLRRASLWIGLALTIALAVSLASGGNSWSADKYLMMVPMSIAPLALGTFIAAARTGNRDRSTSCPPLAEEAPLDGDNRATARLCGLAVPLSMAALVTAIISIGSRIEGGFWIGDSPRRTDSAMHTIGELGQPLLIVAFTGAAGVAAGRAVKRIGPVLIVAVVVWVMTGGISWGFNNPGIHSIALFQWQPLWIDLPTGTVVRDLPPDWLINWPDEYEGLRRALVHQPTVWLHNLYLLGLTTLCCGLALRRHPRSWLVTGGAGLAILAVAGQLAVSPM